MDQVTLDPPTSGIEPAPSQPIAVAARAFGDAYPPLAGQWRVRLAGVILVAATAFYLPWMLRSLDATTPWLSYPFLAANLFTLAAGLLAVFNGWSRLVPERRPLPEATSRSSAVIVPTCNEPVPLILRTIESVYEQDWPADRLVVVVSDDGHDPALEAAVARLPVIYHSPPPRFSPGRDGAAKAGNLNSALALVDRELPGIRYVETRDADDELPSTGFLRQVIGQLEADPQLAFVQTIKEAQVSAGDPFNNRESIFYRGQMLSRNAANAVFPCGSGVVWRRSALATSASSRHGTWSRTSSPASRRFVAAGEGVYLPIVGAVPQHSLRRTCRAVYKQRGTWAVDTVRLMTWARRARAQPPPAGALHGASPLLPLELHRVHLRDRDRLLPCSGRSPIDSSTSGYVVHLLPIVLATEIWLLELNRPYNDRRQKQRDQYRSLWHVRTMWAGLAPVFAKASVQAIASGPNRKPTYKVTRKHDDHRWHWRHTLPQTTVVVFVVSVAIYGLRFGTLPDPVLLLASVYWGGLNVILLEQLRDAKLVRTHVAASGALSPRRRALLTDGWKSGYLGLPARVEHGNKRRRGDQRDPAVGPPLPFGITRRRPAEEPLPEGQVRGVAVKDERAVRERGSFGDVQPPLRPVLG